MILIEHKITDFDNLDSLERDIVTLDWEKRRKSRQRLKTARGIEIILALPTGTVLHEGDILYRDDEIYIVVQAAKEEVITIEPENITQASIVSYEIGNRHLPISIKGSAIKTPYNLFIEDFLKRGNIKYRREMDAFEPIKGGHSHG